MTSQTRRTGVAKWGRMCPRMAPAALLFFAGQAYAIADEQDEEPPQAVATSSPLGFAMLERERRLATMLAASTSITKAAEWLSGMVSAEAVQNCCHRRMCEQLRNLYARIAAGYEICCQKPAHEQQACLNELTDKVDPTLEKIGEALQACEEGKWELVKKIEEILDIWKQKIIQLGTGQVVNEMVVFGNNDWVDLDVWLSSAVGGAVLGPTGPTYTFTLPQPTSANLRFATEFNGIALAGTIPIEQTGAFPQQGTAEIGKPNGFSWVGTVLGETLTLELDATSPYNTLRVDPNGDGTLGVALTIDSDSPWLTGLWQIGHTIWFEFPVTVMADWSAIRIHVDPNTPGSLLTPAEPAALLGADYQHAQPPSIPNNVCADDDNNGIRDGADSLIYAIKSQAGCESVAQH